MTRRRRPKPGRLVLSVLAAGSLWIGFWFLTTVPGIVVIRLMHHRPLSLTNLLHPWDHQLFFIGFGLLLWFFAGVIMLRLSGARRARA